MKNQYKLRSFNCLGCGNHVVKNCKAKSSYCSLVCYRNSKRPHIKKGKLLECLYCNHKIYRCGSEIKDKVFCSVSCHNKYQSKDKLQFKCKICGEVFYWSKSRVETNNPTYCSLDCRNKCVVWKKNAVIAGNLKLQNSKQPTRLEIAGRDILTSLHIDFEEQVLIEGKFIVDVLLKNKKIVIQWDGDYWHGYRSETDNRPLEKRQQKRVNLDKSQDLYMLKCGYKVLRFWEHEIYQQKEKVIEVIKNTI